jgi:hypothetical protein
VTVEQFPPCREVSLGLAEPLTASATAAVSWLLVEHSGPWPAKAPRGVRWPDGLGEQLGASAKRAGVRVNLIRRPAGRDERHPETQVLLVHTGPAAPRLRGLRLPDPRAVLDLDLAALAAGDLPDAGEQLDGVFLVCTHGGRDACCALTGRPVAAALADRFPTRTWESTHLGGHRFAPTMACFPHGLMYGRISADDALQVAAAYREDRILAPFYRGRSAFPPPVQAADAWLRGRLDRWEIDAVRPVATRALDDRVEVELAVVGAATWRLHVAAQRIDPPRRVSCGETEPESPMTYRVLAAESI